MTWPDKITVLHKLASQPRPQDDAMRLDVVVLSERHQRAAARLVEDVVIYDYQAGQKRTLGGTPFLINGLMETWDRQQEAAERNLRKATDVEERVRELEKASWDREGAVEKFGTA